MFCFGTFLAPLIVGPFLAESNVPEAPCPDNFHSFNQTNNLFDPPGGSLFYAFLIVGVLIFLFGILWIILTKARILDHVKESNHETIGIHYYNFCVFYKLSLAK